MSEEGKSGEDCPLSCGGVVIVDDGSNNNEGGSTQLMSLLTLTVTSGDKADSATVQLWILDSG